MSIITIRLLKPHYLDAPFLNRDGEPAPSATLPAGTEIVGYFSPTIANRDGKRAFVSDYGTDYFGPDDFEEVSSG